MPIFNRLTSIEVNHITAVPEIYELLAKFKDTTQDLSTLKVFVSGGSSLTDENYGKIKNTFNIDLLHGWGV